MNVGGSFSGVVGWTSERPFKRRKLRNSDRSRQRSSECVDGPSPGVGREGRRSDLSTVPEGDRRALTQHPSVAGGVTAVPGEDPIQVLGTQVTRDHLGEHISEVGRNSQIATFVEQLALETRPVTQDAARLSRIHLEPACSSRARDPFRRSRSLPRCVRTRTWSGSRRPPRDHPGRRTEPGFPPLSCPRRPANCPRAPPCRTCVSHPPRSAKAISMPTSAFTSWAICRRDRPKSPFGYSAPPDGW